MKRMLHIVPMILSALLMMTFSSCKKDPAPRTRVLTCGYWQDGRFLTDEGDRFRIVSGKKIADDETGRLVLYAEVMKRHGEHDYDINCRNWWHPYYGSVALGSETDPSDLGTDPIGVTSAWLGGGYINLETRSLRPYGSTSEYILRLLLADEETRAADGRDTLHFYLKHETFGEACASELSADMIDNYGFATFAVADCIPEGRDEIPFTLSWPWFTDEGLGLALPVRIQSISGTLKR